MRKVMFGYKGILLSVFLICLLATQTQAAVEWGVDPGDWVEWIVTVKDDTGAIQSTTLFRMEMLSINPDETMTASMSWAGHTEYWDMTPNYSMWIVAKSVLQTAEQENEAVDLRNHSEDWTSAVEKRAYQYTGRINGVSVDKSMRGYKITFTGTHRSETYTGHMWWCQRTGILYEYKRDYDTTDGGYYIVLEDTNANLWERRSFCPFTITVATIPIAALAILEVTKRKIE